MPESLQVRRDDTASRWEGCVADEVVTSITFVRRGDVVVITHTGTAPRMRNQGLAAETTEAALSDIRANAWRVTPVCPFTVDYLDAHPEYDDLRA